MSILFYAIAVCTLIAISSELFALIAPSYLISLLETSPEKLPRGKVLMFLSASSVFYVIDLVLLLLSGDSVFRLYAASLFALSILVWILKSRIRHLKYLIVSESTLCLIILIDVLRTVLTHYLRIFPVN
jgi:hypothetical protein